MRAKVQTFNMKTGNNTAEREVNFKSDKQREWLDKHVLWAINNGHGVQIFNIADDTGALAEP